MKIFTFTYFESIHIRSLFGELRQKAKFLVLLVGLMFSVLVSFGQSNTLISVTPPNGGFEIDGDYSPGTMIPPGTGGDWAEYPTGSGNGVFAPNGIPIVNPDIQYIKRNLDPIGGDPTLDYVFKGGKLGDNPTTWKWEKGTANPSKSDIASAMFFLTKEGDDQWLFVAADQKDGNGTNFITFEFLQETLDLDNELNSSGVFTSTATDGGRTKNDLAIQVNFSNGGTGPADIVFKKWEGSGTTWQYNTYSATGVAFARSTQANNTTNPFGGTLSVNQAVEAAINITKLFKTIQPCAPSIKVKTIMISTTSANDNSNLTDFIFPILQSNIVLGTSIYYGGSFCPGAGSVEVGRVGELAGTYSISPSFPVTINTSTGLINIPDVLNVAGTYTVTYTFKPSTCLAGTTYSVTTSFVVNPKPIGISSTKSICNGASTSISLNAGQPSTFTWTTVNITGGLTGANLGNGSTISQTLNLPTNPSGPGSVDYVVVPTSSAGCTGEPYTITVTVGFTPSVANISTPADICAGGVLNQAAPTVNNHGSAITSEGWEMESIAGSGNFASLSIPYTTVYADNGKKIRYRATNSCGTAYSNEVVVTVDDDPTIASISIPADICAGGALNQAAPTVNNHGSAITSEGWEMSTTVGGSVFTSLSIPYTTVYADNGKKIRYTATNSCGTAYSNEVVVTVDDDPTIAAISTPADLCAGDQLNPTAPVVNEHGSTVTQGWEMSTTVGGSVFASLSIPYTTVYADNGKKIRYRATNSCGTAYSNEVVVTVDDDPTIASISIPADICAGGALNQAAPTVNNHGSAITSEGWEMSTTVGGSVFTSLSIPYTTVYADNGKKIRYTATNSCGTAYSNEVVVTVDDDPTIAAISTPADLCAGDQLNPTAPVVNEHGSTVTQGWEMSTTVGGSVFTSLGIPYTTVYADNGKKIRYTATNSCGTAYSNEVVVTVDDDPTIAAISTPADLCAGDQLNPTAPVVNEHGSTVTQGWEMSTTVGGSVFTSLSIPYTTVYADNGKKIRYTATNSCGTAYSNEVVVTVDDDPTIAAISTPADLCAGDQLNPTAPVVNEHGSTVTQGWEMSTTVGGSVFASLSIPYTTVYADNGKKIRYRATNSCGTAYSNEVVVTVDDDPTIASISIPADICAGGALNQAAPTVNNHGSAITSEGWEMSTTVGGSVFTSLSIPYTTVYADNGKKIRYTATNSCGTAYSNEVVVTVDDDPTIAAISTPADLCAGDQLNPTAPVVNEHGSTVTQGWEMSTTVGGSVFTSLGIPYTTVYADNGKKIRYTATNSCGTAYSNEVVVTVDDDPTIAAISTPADLCAGDQLNPTAPVVNEHGSTVTQGWEMSTTVGGSVFASLSIPYTTVYADNGKKIRYTATNSCGTAYSDEVVVTVDDDPTIAAISTPADLCAGDQLNPTAPVVNEHGSTVTQGWEMSTTVGGSVFTSLSIPYTTVYADNGKKIRYTATNSCGTAYSNEVVVTVDDDPTIAAISTPADLCAGDQLNPTAPVVNEHGSTVTQGWEMSTTVGGSVFASLSIPYTTVYADNGKKIRYRATNSCGTAYSNEVVVTVDDDPTIASISIPADICAGGALNQAAPTVNNHGSAITSEGWEMSTTVGGSVFTSLSIPYTTVYADNGKKIRYTATNSCGTAYSNEVVVTVDDDPTIAAISTPADLCAGDQLNPTAPVVNEHGSTVTQGWEMSTTVGGSVFTSLGIPYTTVYADNGKKIRYTATNSCGTAYSNEVVVTVDDDPTIAAISTPADLCAGDQLNPTAPVVNEHGSTVTQGWEMSTTVGGSVFASLSIPYTTVYADNGKKIRYTATNSCGTAYSNEVVVTVDDDPTIAAISTPADLCAGDQLNPTAPVVNEHGSTVTQGWEMSTTVGGSVFTSLGIPYTTVYADNGKKIRYTATNSCGTAYSNEVVVTVDDDPTIAAISTPADLCAGDQLNPTAPVVNEHGSTVTQGWEMSTTVGGSVFASLSIPYTTVYADNGKKIRYRATNSCGTAYSNEVVVTVNVAPTITNCPSNISQSTDENLCIANVIYTATATGTPTPTLTYSFSGVTSGSGSGTGSGSTFNKGVTNVVITASNVCANVTCSFTVTITDDQKPAIANCAETKDIEGCSTAAIIGPVYSATLVTSSEAEFEDTFNNGVASDNCGITTVTYIDVVSSPSCPIIVTRTWTLMDAASNSTTCTQTINIKDTTAPTWTTSATNLNRTLSCEDEVGLTNAQALVPVANDACDAVLTPIKTSGSFVSSGCGNAGSITNTFKVADTCGNISGTFTQVITIADIKAPTWVTGTSDLNRTLSCEDADGLTTAQALIPTASDNCDLTLTPVKTVGAFVQSGCGNAGSYTNTFKVTDDCGNVNSIFTQIITITDSKAPIWTSNANALDRTLSCEDTDGLAAAQALVPLASDNCDLTLTPIKTSGSFISAGCGYSGSYTNTFKVTDDCGNISGMFTQVITITDTKAPVITGSLGSTTVEGCTIDAAPDPVTTVDELIALGSQSSPLNITDNCTPNDQLVVTSSDASDIGCPIKIFRTYNVTDLCGNSTTITSTYIIEVNDFTPPAISGVPAAITYSCASNVPAGQTTSVTVLDNCIGQVSVTVTDETTPGICENKFTIKRIWTAKDVCGNTSSATQIITVDDQIAPTIQEFPENLTVSCTGEIPAANTSSVTATDNCNGTVSVTVSTDVISNQNCDNQYTISRTYWVTDVCGNQMSRTQTILVDDQIAPSINSIPDNLTVSCASDVPAANTSSVTASDNCGGSVSITVSEDVISNIDCVNRYTISRIYWATDACGNIASSTQTIKVDDQIAPIITLPTEPLTMQCFDAATVKEWTDLATANDNCAGSVSVTASYTAQIGTCNQSVTVTFTAMDTCNNTATATKSFTVNDDIAPVITLPAQPLTMQCFDVATVKAWTDLATANDICNGSVSVTASYITPTSKCSLSVTVTFTAMDACGNTVTATKSFTVNDDTAPVISGTLGTVSVEGCSVENAPAPVSTVAALETLGLSINDACTTDANLSVSSSQTSSGTCPIVVTRVYTVTDACGNSSNATQIINVSDTTAPVARGKNITLSLNPQGTVNFDASDIDGGSTDNCSIKTLIASKTSFTCSELGAHTVTLTVIDSCGNTSTATATVTVTDPNPPSISINDVEVNESIGNAALTVTLANARACDVSFTVNTSNSTALAPDDYTTVSSTVYTIPGGSTTVTVYVPITDDKVAEPTETFVVKLSNPINSVIADDQGIVPIIDDDSPPNVIIGDASATEGGILNFPVSLSNISSIDITVTVGFTHVTTSDGDFVMTPVTVSFPAGTKTATASVQSISDYNQEGNETFIVKVTGTTGPVGNTSDTGTGTIVDDDQKPIAVDDNLTSGEDIVLQGNVNVNDYPNMKPGDVWSLLTQPLHGTVTMNPDGSFVYTPNPDYNGNDSFTYKLCDTDGDCDDATVFITMTPVDDFPVANDDTFTAHMDGSIDDYVDDNDIPSGDGGNVWSIVKQPTTGTVIFNPDGSFTYTPNVGYLGNDSFTYKLCDVDGDCDEAVVNIVVDDIIPNQIFTPNGDGQNDTYYVKNLEFYSGSRITIFNRWGNKVYQKTGYLNDWDGYSNMNKVGSKPLPVGTYYYVIDYGVNRHKTGFVYLER